jgi:hypothetical protein
VLAQLITVGASVVFVPGIPSCSLSGGRPLAWTGPAVLLCQKIKAEECCNPAKVN